MLQRIANESADGRVATTRIQALQQKKAAELNDKNKQLPAMQQKLEKEGAVMSATAAGRPAEAGREAPGRGPALHAGRAGRSSGSAAAAAGGVPAAARADPAAGRTEKGLHFIFNGPDAGLVWADAALDISSEVIKKLDSAKPTAAKPAAPTKPPGQ